MKYTSQAIAVGKRHCRVLYLCYVPHLPKKCCIMSGRATAIFVGARSPTIPANNLQSQIQSQKPAPTGILSLIDRTLSNTISLKSCRAYLVPIECNPIRLSMLFSPLIKFQ